MGVETRGKSDGRFSRPYACEMRVRRGIRDCVGFDADDGDSSARTVTMRFAQRGFGDGGADGGFIPVWTRPSCWPSTSAAPRKVREAPLRASARGAASSPPLVAAGASRASSRASRVSRYANLLANCGGEEAEGHAWDVRPLAWGLAGDRAGGEKFDLVVATDCMYVEEAAGALVDALASLVGDVGVEGGRREILPGRRSSRAEETDRRRRR